MKLDKIAEELDIIIEDLDYQQYIGLWKEFYQGNVTGFHSYEEFNGAKNTKIERMSLGMAKKTAEDWADTLFNPETTITVDERYQDRLDELFQELDLVNVINDQLERGFALGTSALITNKVDGKVTVSVASADMLYPVTSDNKDGWLVLSGLPNGDIYLSIHWGDYTVHNHILRKEDKEYKLLPKHIAESEYGIESIIENKVPMIHIIRPANSNNINEYSKYGLSIYANAIDELKGVDIAYSRLNNEIEVGKMRIFAQVETMESFDGKPKFPNNEGFYIMEGEGTFSDGTTVKTHSPALRTALHIDALNTNLNLLGRKCGFGDNSYSFNDGSIYTNTTQVISSNSKFFKTRQRHLGRIESMVISLVNAIHFLDTGKEYKGDISVDFDDSIIMDEESIRKHAKEDLLLGVIDEVEYLMQVYNLTEELAQEQYNKMLKRKGIEEEPEFEGGEE